MNFDITKLFESALKNNIMVYDHDAEPGSYTAKLEELASGEMYNVCREHIDFILRDESGLFIKCVNLMDDEIPIELPYGKAHMVLFISQNNCILGIY